MEVPALTRIKVTTELEETGRVRRICYYTTLVHDEFDEIKSNENCCEIRLMANRVILLLKGENV